MKVINSSSFTIVAGTIACFTAILVRGSELSTLLCHDLPAILVETSGHTSTAKDRSRVPITLISSNSIHRYRADISMRGSSSANHPKKPYRLELQDENGEDTKRSLLGMPQESDWILYPSYTDKTMIRDVLAHELWRQMGYWSPRTRYVHLFIITNSPSSSSSSSSISNSASSALNFHSSTNPFIQLSNSYEGV